jgi:release factor glutamine methyltransferase
MKTIGEVFKAFQQELSKLYDTREIDAIALLVMTEILHITRSSVKAFPELQLTEAHQARLATLLQALKTGQPVQYALGETWFYDLPFKVNPSVLIPRPETEELVQWVLAEFGWRNVDSGDKNLTGTDQQQSPINILSTESGRTNAPCILDIGTGSGCIAVALKKNLPAAHASALDLSAEAIKTAKDNAALNEVDVEFFQADILKPDTYSTKLIGGRYTVIVSNPPYVTPLDQTKMHRNVVDFEPHSALFVPENDPLVFYKAIAGFALAHLEEDGLLFFEINEAYGAEVVNMLLAHGFNDIELKQDMSGRDRMIKAVK